MRIKEFANRIRNERWARKLNQTKFASLVGVTQSTISAWERAEFVPDIPQLIVTANRLGLNPAWLAHGEGDKFASHAAEDQSPYTADPLAAELLDVISELDPDDRARILAEAKDRLLLKKLKEQIDRAQPGGGSEERHAPTLPPQQAKKGRRETA